MGSTVCVRCGANLIPHSYCDICHDVLCFICSSCSMNTIERIHTNCHNASTLGDNNNIYLQDPRELLEEPIVINNNYINAHYYIQNQLNEKIKDNSIKLSKSYWDSTFEAIKLVNTHWNRIFNIGKPNSSMV
ncbi:MAG TPA: hypothetical protein VD694_02310 [Nitrososphaeraceae archaeon]|nr:hypothetical protein [Nitrososphaeraceae archaeon]